VCFLIVTIPFQVFLKGIHLISIMGNQGTFTKNFKQMVTDAELLYHFAYVVFCVLGLCMHPFFYSVLVSILKLIYILQYFLAWAQI
jgi:inositol 1,4,5-triphosphate receptor type 1